jgi:hypothetical protein
MNLKKTSLTALGVVALAVPAAAIAKPGGDHGRGHGHGGNPTVSYVFKGTYEGAGVVSVEHGNGHVKKADLIGDVQFDLTDAKLTVADANDDGSVTAEDVAKWDRVVVKSRLPKKDPGAQPFAAMQLVDQTNPGSDSGDED